MENEIPETIRGNILLVDDDEALAGGMQTVLELRGHQVTHCLDGNAGLVAADEGEFDAVLTDFRMPGLGGMQLLEKIREKHPRPPGGDDDGLQHDRSRDRSH